ncbi:branched-chain amino acid ABC transporter permease [Halovenus sp. HT40]|uniref:branched-chain amino acid ABC transporter permease n=1 Tax=Halovenus sp. HT40 TaxID=3126691 RepID=UPI00300E7370
MIEQLALDPLFVGDLFDLLTSPGDFSGVLVEGLAKASLYLMIASGLTLIFGLMDVINFAHGAFTMYGAYIAAGLMLGLVTAGMGWGTVMLVFLGVIVLVFAILAALGTLFEVTLVRKLYEYPPIYQILLTFGITITMEQFMRMIVEFRDINNGQWNLDWASPRRQTLPSELGDGGFLFIEYSNLQLFEILLGVLTVVGIWAFLNKTRYGLFVRAGVEDEEMAKALGVNVQRTFTVVFAIGSGIAGAAGVILMWDPLWSVSVPLALDVLLPAFVIVIVGGLGSFKGTVVASLLVGMIDALGTWAFTTGVIEFTGVDELMIFSILVVMLILRPRGLFGVEGMGDHG